MFLSRRAVLCVVAAAVAASASACAEGKTQRPPLESLDQLVSRRAPRQPGGAIAFGDAPTSYRLEYDLYVKGHTKGDIGGSGPRRRTLLDATRR